MQHKLSLIGSLGLALNGMAAYVPSEPWSTLTPEGTLAGTITDYSYTFGIAINPVTAEGGKKVKRDVVTQIGDGQIQATTATASSTSTAAVVTQIGDGQIQATTSTASAAAVVTQIGDGQIQATTATPSTTSTAGVVTQIGDGQIQADTTTSSAAVVTQIGDGQIQATTSHNTVSAASQISDGQVQASSTATNSAEAAAQNDSTNPVNSVSCWSDSALSMTLNGTILTDSHGRIGSIVANRQFQFDGPPPQAGAIYAAGWSITDEGRLAIGNTTEFYQCLSGSFYNLYDEHIGSQCEKVYLDVVDLVKC